MPLINGKKLPFQPVNVLFGLCNFPDLIFNSECDILKAIYCFGIKMKRLTVGLMTLILLVACTSKDAPRAGSNSPAQQVVAPPPKVSDSMLVAQAHISMLKNESQCESFKIELLKVGKGGTLKEKDTAQIVRTMVAAETAKCTAY